jgi:acyl carrier protein phosphodiesterase
MNFLAHALLAGDEDSLVVGGVAGDWIKGPLPGSLPDDIARGVALHRAIDSHADLQPAFKRSRSRISPERRRYAGVLIDIFYDHLLARNWSAISQVPLASYSSCVYKVIDARLDDLPPASRPGLKLMAAEDWLSSYAQIDGIADVLVRMSRRARRPNPLAGGEQEFLADVAGYTEDFDEWFTDARGFCTEWKRLVGRLPIPLGITKTPPASDMKKMSRATYLLWRLDDNGNTFLVDTFTDKTLAEKKMGELSAGGHKQTYWITQSYPTGRQ